MYTAKQHVRIGTRSFKPGEEVPQDMMSDAVWKRLWAKKAIEGGPDPVEAMLEADESPVPTEPEEPEDQDAEPAEPEAPEDQAAEPAEPEKAAPAKAVRKQAKKAAGAKDLGTEPPLPAIDAGDMVVTNPRTKRKAGKA